jgi:UDP-N-acetylmuramoyl-L-alanyl-D-glutamate--2,6-diaminopimelate ligase
MLLSNILADIYMLPPGLDREIGGLALDSRLVKRGDLFFACRGTQQDGRAFIADAIDNGAAAVLTDESGWAAALAQNVPVIPLPNLGQYVSLLAATFYGNPAASLKIVGVTGTTGKTSCTYFIAAALAQLNIPCGIIGSLGAGVFGNIVPGQLTTPDAITLQAIFARFVRQKIKIVAMEVSSHSIEQGRINAIPFTLAIFTNLSRDHLDYHGDMETYGAVKKRLLDSPNVPAVVINADDDFGNKIIPALHDQKTVYAYSVHSTVSSVPLIAARNIQLDGNGIQAEITSPWGKGNATTKLMGEFNLSNLLAVLASLCFLDIKFTDALQSLAALQSVPGRMQIFSEAGQPVVIVDFAHKPDALEKVLQTLRKHCHGKLYCIFGCGGERDKGKRPLMAKIAEQLSDYVIVTDDNPRHEDPAEIVVDIMRGFSSPEKVTVQHDRTKAIQDVIQSAAAGDCILVAGKGAETYQLRGDTKIPLDDAEIVKQFLLSLTPEPVSGKM